MTHFVRFSLMKSSERHELRQNVLLELLKDPRELARRYGLTAVIVLIAASVAVYFIYRAAGAEQRKWQRAWQPLQTAVASASQEQLQTIAADSGSESLVRCWAYIRYGELLYNKSQQSDAYIDTASRTEFLNQAVTAFGAAVELGPKYRQVVGQAGIGLGLCYENLDQPDLALLQYESIIDQAEDRFDGTVWLIVAQSRKNFLSILPEERIVFVP